MVPGQPPLPHTSPTAGPTPKHPGSQPEKSGIEVKTSWAGTAKGIFALFLLSSFCKYQRAPSDAECLPVGLRTQSETAQRCWWLLWCRMGHNSGFCVPPAKLIQSTPSHAPSLKAMTAFWSYWGFFCVLKSKCEGFSGCLFLCKGWLPRQGDAELSRSRSTCLLKYREWLNSPRPWQQVSPKNLVFLYKARV